MKIITMLVWNRFSINYSERRTAVAVFDVLSGIQVLHIGMRILARQYIVFERFSACTWAEENASKT